MLKTENGFKYSYTKEGHTVNVDAENPGESLFTLNPYDSSIAQLIDTKVEELSFKYLNESILPRSLFSIESDFVEKNPNLVREYNSDAPFDPNTEIKLLTNDRAGSRGRSKWFIAKRDVITTGKPYIDKWKVVVISANPGGQRRSNQIEVIDNLSAFGRSKVALKAFDTQAEANNFLKYMTSELIRFALLLTDEALTSVGKKVPDMLDYSDDNGIIDFSGDVNSQLYALFGISDSQQDYIREVLATYPQ